jgi:arginine N-succinyltransferase
MPEYPIYIDLLPEMAKSVIGKPHQLGEPALNMLFKEGFHYENFVDIFDAGPTVHAYVENIETIKNSQEKLLSDSAFSEAEAVECLVCNASITNFRVCQAKVNFMDDGSVTLTPEVIAALLLNFEESLRVYPLNK